MIEDISKSFSAFSKTPFLFVWGSLMYIILLLAFLFAAFGLVLAYFLTLSVFNKAFDLSSIPTMAVVGLIALAFVFFSNGLNAALARAYRSAFWKEKVSLTKFYSYALDKAPETFGIMLLRDFIWLMLAGPGIAVYIIFLKGVDFMDMLTYGYVLFITFAIHMVFTPAFIAAGGLGMGLFSSLRNAFEFLRKKHIYFIGLYALFAVTWVLNFVPIIQVVSIFFAYPVLYNAMIVMMEGKGKAVKKPITEEDEEE